MPGIIAPPGYRMQYPSTPPHHHTTDPPPPPCLSYTAEELGRFAKMLKVGIPEGSVRGKMAAEGFDDDMFDKYLNPETGQVRH